MSLVTRYKQALAECRSYTTNEKSANLGERLNTAPVWMAAGGLGGAGLGRYVAAPIASRLLGLDADRARRVFTLLGLGVGSLPGLQLGLARRKLHGSFFAPSRVGKDLDSQMRYTRYALGNPRRTYSQHYAPPAVTVSGPGGREMEIKRSSQDPMTYSRELWKPTFPVSQSLDEISNNPMIPVSQRVKMKDLVAQAGREQGVGLTGLASPGALMEALPKVVSYAVPTAGGAWAASKLLGAPKNLKRTAVGSALVYSALKGFMEKGSSDESERVEKQDVDSGLKIYSLHVGNDEAGSVKVCPSGDKYRLFELQVGKPHRGRGYARKLMHAVLGDFTDKPVWLHIDPFNDKPVGKEKLREFYMSLGFQGSDDGMVKANGRD